MASIFLIVPLGLTHHLTIQPTNTHAFSQSYYYALISAALYFIISTLLLFNLLGAYVFNAYPPSFNSLTIPQRTLMLQTISYTLYLALGAGVFARIEGWEYADGVYWADYTLLTVGLGTDFPLKKTLSRALLIPYAVGGITALGLIIGSVRGLVLERGKTKVMRRAMGRKREERTEKMKTPEKGWRRREFEVMRQIEESAEKVQRWSALVVALGAYFVVWFGGAAVFWFTEDVRFSSPPPPSSDDTNKRVKLTPDCVCRNLNPGPTSNQCTSPTQHSSPSATGTSTPNPTPANPSSSYGR